MIALHSFFAQTLPILQAIDGEASSVLVVNDNARGLTKKSACSERRRILEALASPGASRGKISRWESELPDLLTFSNSPPSARRTRANSLRTTSLPETMVAPQIPKRRTSVQESNAPSVAAEEETTSHSRGSQSSNSSRSCRSCDSEGSADYPLAPPRRRTSCLAWLDEVEANDLLVPSESTALSEMKLQPKSKNTSLDLLVRMDAQVEPTGSKDGRKARNKNAPRRPRRMRSMDETFPQPHYDIVNGVTDDESLRTTLSDSIHSVMRKVKSQTPEEKQQQQPAPHKLSSSEQIILKDAVKGVVGALSRRTSMRGLREMDASSGAAGTAPSSSSNGGRKGSSGRQKRESPSRAAEVRLATPLEGY